MSCEKSKLVMLMCSILKLKGTVKRDFRPSNFQKSNQPSSLTNGLRYFSFLVKNSHFKFEEIYFWTENTNNSVNSEPKSKYFNPLVSCLGGGLDSWGKKNWRSKLSLDCPFQLPIILVKTELTTTVLSHKVRVAAESKSTAPTPQRDTIRYF